MPRASSPQPRGSPVSASDFAWGRRYAELLAGRAGVLLLVVLGYVLVAAVLLPADMGKGPTSEMRYIVPLLAIGVTLSGLALAILWRFCRPLASLAAILLLTTNWFYLGFTVHRLDGASVWWPPMLYRYAYELRNPYENGNEAMVNLLRQLPAGTTVRIWPPFMTYPPMFYVPGLHYCDQLTEKKAVREDLRRQLPDYVYVERTRPDVMFVPAAFLKKALEELQRRYGSKAYRVVKTLRPDWRYTSKPELPMHAFWRPGGSWFEHPGMVVLAAVGSPVENHRALAGGAIDAESVSNLGTALLTDGEIDMAESCFRQALQLDSTNAVAQCELGNALVKKDKTADAAEAAEHYRAAIRTNPRYVERTWRLASRWRGSDIKPTRPERSLWRWNSIPIRPRRTTIWPRFLPTRAKWTRPLSITPPRWSPSPTMPTRTSTWARSCYKPGLSTRRSSTFRRRRPHSARFDRSPPGPWPGVAKIGEYDAAAAEFSLALTKLPPHSPLEPAIREMLKKLEK